MIVAFDRGRIVYREDVSLTLAFNAHPMPAERVVDEEEEEEEE